MIKKNPALWLAVLLSIIFIVLAVVKVDFIESLELTTYDLRMKLRAPGAETGTDIVLVDVDDESITKLGRWPWPRTLIARMIDKLKNQGVRQVGLNVMFSEPEMGEGLKLVEELTADFSAGFSAADNPAAGPFLAKLSEARDRLDSDRRLAEAIGQAGNVILPVFFQIGEFPQAESDLPEALLKNGMVQARGPAEDYMIPAKKITAPIDRFFARRFGTGAYQHRSGQRRRGSAGSAPDQL